MSRTKVNVVDNLLKANDAVASANRQLLQRHRLLAVNIMSAPGSGKTTLLRKTIDALAPRRCAVLVGDLQTTRDADRLAGETTQTVQINTGRGCHLSSTMVQQGLEALDLASVDFLFIENVGNMVCPTSHDLGEHVRAALLSLPEGDDKVAKYPTLFQSADVVVLNKMDLAGVLDFDIQRVVDDLAQLNSHAPLLRLSSGQGDGLDTWLDWLSGAYDRVMQGRGDE